MRSLTVFLFGGLGNQLFQYAAGRALSLKHDAPLILDKSGFGFDTHYRRSLELDNFRIAPGLAESNSLWKFKAGRLVRRLSAAVPLAARLVRPGLIAEVSPAFDATVLQTPVSGSVSMTGYWQDERYFLDVKSTIEAEFQPVQPLSAQNAEMKSRIAACAAPVAVHIRHRHGLKADERDTPQNLAERVRTGVTLPQQYYRQGMQLIEKNAQKPTYFIFADDPEWAHASLALGDDAILMSKGRGPDHEDMVLMSQCSHHLIANSSFSWWGAWLARNPAKVVVAPKGYQYTPNIPGHWISI